jgi:hypothetical protein
MFVCMEVCFVMMYISGEEGCSFVLNCLIFLLLRDIVMHDDVV